MNSLPFRIKLGVTGHRTGIDADALKGKLRTILNVDKIANGKPAEHSILSLCSPSSLKAIRNLEGTPLAFCIYTALAEGADRIVADAVLEIDQAIMKVVLPLVEEEYEEDFQTADSLSEFHRLLHMDPNPVHLRRQHLLEEWLPDQVI